MWDAGLSDSGRYVICQELAPPPQSSPRVAMFHPSVPLVGAMTCGYAHCRACRRTCGTRCEIGRKWRRVDRGDCSEVVDRCRCSLRCPSSAEPGFGSSDDRGSSLRASNPVGGQSRARPEVDARGRAGMRGRWVAFFACAFAFGSPISVKAAGPSGGYPPSIYPPARYFPSWGSPGGCPSLSARGPRTWSPQRGLSHAHAVRSH